MGLYRQKLRVQFDVNIAWNSKHSDPPKDYEWESMLRGVLEENFWEGVRLESAVAVIPLNSSEQVAMYDLLSRRDDNIFEAPEFKIRPNTPPQEDITDTD